MRFLARTFAALTDVVRKQMKAQTKDLTHSLISLAAVSVSASQPGNPNLKSFMRQACLSFH